MLSMLYSLAAPHSKPPRTVWWIHGARRANECALGNEVRQLLSSLGNSHHFVAFSNPGPTDRIGSDFNVSGHINLELLRDLSLPTEAEFYLCGPSTFLRDIKFALRELGVPQEFVHEELFGIVSTAGRPNPRSDTSTIHTTSIESDAPLVTFTRTGATFRWDKRFKNILELAETYEVPVKWSCRTGVCHVCECGLLDGQLSYAPAPLDDPATGNALICCSTPKSNVTFDL